MANKQYTIGINFDVDKRSLDSLNKSLDEVISKANINNNVSGYSESFKQAAEAAKSLKNIMNEAWNPKIGQIDYSKVEKGITDLYGSVKNFKSVLGQVGTEGPKAFNTLAQSILEAQMPIKQTSKFLDQMADTFAKTIRYGIASSVWNNFSNSISKAYGYVQDLDESLNNIRIVSGASADEMEQLAVQANKTAQALGKTTLDYTNAALIYYQQGLSGAEAQERTDITLKLSNVLKKSTEEVSNYMTAIWNNFDDGSQSLEHYADVLTALGATTAASSEEIAQGLEKFAAIGETVGLSYEYATSALATVVAETRQSADVVGTAFKTIFARMQDLELGNTLDDGTTLGKYSEALEKVGINIKDSSGELKNMDDILNEMGSKWQTIGKDQQVALAEAVAGTRQYSQLMALMNNWDKFQINLGTAQNSNGSLQEQQEIYLESMEAHLKTLKGAWEGVYKTLFDKKSTGALIDTLTAFINIFNNFIEGLGGGLNALSNIGLQIANIFNKQIGSSIEKQIENIELWKRNRDSLKAKESFAEEIKNNGALQYSSGQTKSEVETVHAMKGENISSGALEKEAGIAERLLNIKKGLTSEEYKELTSIQQNIGLQQTKLDKINDYNEKYKESSTTLQNNKEYYETELEQQEKLLTYLELGTKSSKEVGAQAQLVAKLGEELSDVNGEATGYLAGISEEQTEILEKVQNEALTEEEVAELIEKQKQLIDEQKGKIQETGNAIQAKKDAENGVNTQLEEQIRNEERIIAAKEKQVQRELAIQKTIAITTGLVQAASSFIGGLSVALDKDSSASEKMNGYWSAGLGTISSIANMLLPGSGVIVQGIGAIAQGILKSTGLWEKFENHFKSTKERLEDLNKEMEEFQKKQKEAVSELKDKKSAEEYFKSIKDRFESLQNLANKGLLPNDLQNEYEGYLDKIQQYNKDIIVSYDTQGKMITKNNNAIQDTIDKLQEENKALLSQTYGGDNWNDYAKQQEKDYNNKKSLWEKTQLEYSKQLNETTYSHDIAGNRQSTWGVYDFAENDDLHRIMTFLNNDENFKDMFESDNWEKQIENPEKWKEQTTNYINDFIKNLEDKGKLEWTNDNNKKRTYEAFEGFIDRYYQQLSDIKSNYGTDKAKTVGSQSVDLSFILNNLKYDASQKGTYENLAEQIGEENTDTILNAYLNGIDVSSKEFKDKNGNLQYDKIRQKVKDIQTSLIDIFTGSDGEELKNKFKDILETNSIGISSQEYENIMTKKIEEFLSQIDTEEQFNQIKDLLPSMFGLKSVSAEWKDGKAQLGKNGGNIVTIGEDIVRTIGKILAEQNIGEKGNKEDFAKNVEQYLQNSLDEVDLQDLDVTKLATDFNNLLYNAIDENTGDLRAGLSMESILQDAIDAQTAPEQQKDKKVTAALAPMQKEIENLDLDETEIKNYTKHIMEMADESKELADSLEDDADAATVVSKAVIRMNRGVQSLSDNFKDWNDVLKKSSKSSQEYYEALDKTKEAVADILDIKKEDIDTDFITDPKQLKLIEEAAKGSAEAIDKLKAAYAKEVVMNITLDKGLDENLQNEVSSMFDNLQDKFAQLKLGKIDDQEFIDSCQKMIETAGLTAEESQKMFDAWGISVKFKTEEKDVEQRVPRVVTVRDITQRDEFGNPTEWVETSHQDGFDTFTGKADAFAMASNGKTPEIESLTKKSTGAMNNLSATNKGGKKGKNGGGQSSKKDLVNTEIDRYHKVNTQITKVDNSLKKLQSQQEKFVGKKLLDNLNAQWEELNTQINNYNEKLRIANEEQAELSSKLSSKGVVFNADGTVSNYTEAIKAQEAYMNGLYEQFNKMSSEAQKQFEENTLKQAEKDFEQFKTDINRYDELVSSFIPDIKQSIQDAIDKQIENQIAKFDLEIKVTLDMNQATRDWNAWVKRAVQKFDSEDIFGEAQAKLKDFFTYFNEQGTADIQVAAKHVNEILEELQKLNNNENGVFGDANGKKSEALEKLKEHYTQLMQSITEVIELQDELHEKWLDKIDEVQEKFNKQTEMYEFLREILNHDIKLIQMNLGEKAYSQMAKFYDTQQKNYEKQLDFQRQLKDFWYAEMQAAEQGSKEWDAAREKWKEAVSQFNAILEEGLENAKTKFENAINEIFENLNQSLTDGMGLEYINEQWDLINKNADRYLDTVNATYAIREIEKKYMDSINQTNNVATQQRIQKIMNEQLENLKQKDRLTQYDVDRANKLYEIEMARIALEEAQKNKSQMRLRRDSQGNYSYQYVANSDAIDEAEQKLSGLYNEMYNFDKERYNSVLNDVYSTWTEYQEKMAAAALINDPEERAQREALIQKEYNELMLQIETDYQTSKYNLQESFFSDWVNLNNMTLENFKNLTDNEKDIIMTEMVPTWKNGITEMIGMMTGKGGFATISYRAWSQIKNAQAGYDEDVANLEDISKQTFDSIANGLDENIAKTQEFVQQNEELIDAYGKELEAVKEIYEQVKALRDMYKEAEEAAIATAEAAYKTLHQEQEQQQADYANQNKTAETTNAAVSSTPETNVTAVSDNGSGGNGNPEVGEVVTYNGGKYYSTSTGGRSGSRSGGTQVKITIIRAGRPYPIHIANLNGGALGWIRQDQISGYDTGGYTGTWNNDGRLAVLHQKELVLNTKDTENMLNAVSVMRTLAYSLGSSVLARIAGVGANGINGGVNAGTALEQNVHIDATFPNVRDAAEIEEALNNLTNAASQRIMENR